MKRLLGNLPLPRTFIRPMRSHPSVRRSPFGRLLAPLALIALLAPSLAFAGETSPVPAVPETPGKVAPPVSAPDAPAPADAVAARLQSLRERILGRLADPGVAADLYELRDLALVGGSLERVADTLYRVAGSRAHPEVKALAHRIAADVERTRGRLPRMEANLAAIGSISEVALIGPFDDENKGGYDQAFGPELDLDLDKAHAGLRSEVRWRTVDGLGATGRLALDQAVRPNHEVLVYALTVLDVPGATNGVIHLGTPGAAKGWLNGKPILADPRYHPARFDQGSIPVKLARGSNVLLLKLAAGATAPFEVELRVTGADGRPIRGLRVSAPTSGRFAKPQAIAAGTKILPKTPLLDLLAKAAQGGSPAALLDYARVLGERQPFDDAERLHEAAAVRAAKAAPNDVDALLLAARWQDDANDRRTWLEKAVAVERPGQARAHSLLASWWSGEGDTFRAMQILRGRIDAAAGDWPARIRWARALDNQGFQARARKELELLAEQYRDEPLILDELARMYRRDGQTDDAMRLWRVSLAHRPANETVAGELASALIDRGQIDEADRVLEGVDRLSALDLSRILRRADLLGANGRGDRAGALYARAAAVAPGEGEVFEREGQAQLRAGDTEAALASFERSLAVRPQNAQLKELVELLRPGAAGFAKPFLHDLTAAVQGASDKWPGEDAVKLVDFVATRVLPSGQASRTVQSIVQVRTDRGVDRFRSFPIRYAPDREEVKVERARVLKADGTIVDAHSENQRSMNEPWSGLYYDARALVVGFPSLAPGDTVELVYRVDDVARDNLLGDYFGDVSYVQDTVPVATWDYVLEMPAGRQIYANQPEGTKREERDLEGGNKLYRWTATDVPRVSPEAQMPGWSEVARYLHVSTYQDWQSVARFWWGLVKDQVQPTPEIERVAREVVKEIPASDTAARVRAIYDFVVTNTRYVGLEFGIHSFKPYKVEQILRRRFGDCKDKASLTWSLFKSIGIDADLVLLRMRHLGRIGGDPASLAVFNHAILYVPSLDLWLDGTAEWSGSRELPEADRGAEVLVVEPGGKATFRTIPEAPADLSGTSTKQLVALQPDGAAQVTGESTVRGIPAPGYRRAYASPNSRTSSFEQAWARSYPGVTVTKLDVSDPTRIEEDVKLGYGLTIPRYAERRGDGSLAFSPFGEGQSYVEGFAPLSTRRHDLVLRHAFQNGFRHEIALPAGFSVDQVPESKTLESPFGTVEVVYGTEAGKLVVTGRIALSVPRVTPADYPAFRAFLAEADGLLRRKIVLRPAET